MTNVHQPAFRSYNMSQIKGKNTKPEMLIRKFLYSQGFRYRLHDLGLPGKPDIVLKKFNSVMMVQGGFWHGHEDCEYFVLPKTRTEWWSEKIAETRQRDEENELKLKNLG
ncbi:very short patch repair endonuclease [Ulvibacterium sp.]|uniref:very short patch repair endonuclease n=1 Tax=Ulvibacterium sp. TaxID=2665914 RepID=UPI00260EC344|nr:very short patch repair endonuclease [Ulvibacterium sp.]